jgi:hypothetical protein
VTPPQPRVAGGSRRGRRGRSPEEEEKQQSGCRSSGRGLGQKTTGKAFDLSRLRPPVLFIVWTTLAAASSSVRSSTLVLSCSGGGESGWLQEDCIYIVYSVKKAVQVFNVKGGHR